MKLAALVPGSIWIHLDPSGSPIDPWWGPTLPRLAQLPALIKHVVNIGILKSQGGIGAYRSFRMG